MPKISKKIIYFLYIIIFFASINSLAQDKTIKHKILKGETISSIAKNNNVTINDIYKLNPNAKKILKLNAVLLIPVIDNKKEKKSSKIEPEIVVEITHQVAPKETLYAISRKYKKSIENLKKWNPILENSNLEIGQILYVSEINLFKPDANAALENIIHEVLPKETKYSLAKKYKTTIQKLEELNPQIVNNLPIGFKLIIKKSKADNNIAVSPEKVEVKIDTIKIIQKTEEIKVIPAVIETEIIQEKDPIEPVKPISNLELPNILEQRAIDNIGTKYHSGGTKPGGFDCSGLMIYTFENSGIKLPRTSAEQSRFGTTIDKSEAQKGDLIFFSTNGRGNVNHVGMVVENTNGEIKFIHSSIHAGVIISSTSEGYYNRTFKFINRVIK